MILVDVEQKAKSKIHEQQWGFATICRTALESIRNQAIGRVYDAVREDTLSACFVSTK
jgi:hypothetical protein